MDEPPQQPRRRLAALLGMLAGWTVVAMAAPAVAAEDGTAWPWRQGDRVGSWTVTDCHSHPEYYRCSARMGERQTGFELVRVADCSPHVPWCAALHRLQPAPATEPDEALLQALMPRLQQWHPPDPRERPRAPRLQRHTAAHQAPRPRVDYSSAPLAWLFLTLWMGAVATLWQQARLAGRHHRWVALAWLAAPLLAWAGARSLHIDATDVTVLHEGGTLRNLGLVDGHNWHTGPALAWAAWLFDSDKSADLFDMTRLNIACASCVGVALVAWRPSVGVAAMVLVSAALPYPRLALAAEMGDALQWVIATATLPSLCALAEPRSRWSRSQVWAGVHVALGAACLGLVRTEASGWLIAALAWHGVRWHAGGAGDWVWRMRLRRTIEALRRPSWPLLVTLLIPVVLLWLNIDHLRLSSRWQWLIDGVNPLHPGLRTLPLWLLGVAPLGCVVATAVGIAVVLRRHGAGWGWLPIAWVVLFQAWYSASHGVWFEIVRYGLSTWFVVAALCACAIGAAVAAWQRCGARQRVAWVAAAVAWFVPPLPRAAAWKWDVRPGALSDAPRLDHDQQAEVRMLLRGATTLRHCAWLSRIHLEHERQDAPERYAFVLSGPTQAYPQVLGDDAAAAFATAYETAAQHHAQAPCVVFYRGLDCHLLSGPDCTPWSQSPALIEQRRPSRVWSDPIEYGAHASDLRIGFYPMTAPPQTTAAAVAPP